MNKQNLLIALRFFVIWIGFTFYNGIASHFHELPMGVHQGAQCDRASLAQNYYYNGFRFLYPEVNEDRCIDGIVSCELPLTAYLSAIAYKVFAYDEFWFRLISFCFFSLGMFALFLLFKTKMKEIMALILVLLIQSTPILMFYAANFLPDISALGLSLVAIYIFYRNHFPHLYLPPAKSRALDILMILAFSLSIASKTTNIIHWLSIFAVCLLSYFPVFKIEIINRKKAIITLLISLIIPISWFFWSRHLAQTHNFQYFMMRIPWSESIESYKTSWLTYLANWPRETFSEPLIYIAVTLLFLLLFFKKFISNALWYLSFFNTLGSLAFLFVMIEQFKYHDYYIISLYPAFALNWLALSEAFNKIPSKFWYAKFIIAFLVIYAFSFQLQCGITNLNERFTPGNYWEQSSVNARQYDTLRQMLVSKGINHNACVAAGYDPGPNNILYLLHLRGHRLSREHDSTRWDNIINGSRPKYLISNDSSIDIKVRSMTEMKQILEFRSIRVYELLQHPSGQSKQ